MPRLFEYTATVTTPAQYGSPLEKPTVISVSIRCGCPPLRCGGFGSFGQQSTVPQGCFLESIEPTPTCWIKLAVKSLVLF